MANIRNNRLDVTIPAQDMAAAQQHFSDLRSLFPFLMGLATGEKATRTGIQVDNKQWVLDCLNEMEQDSSFLPSFLRPNLVKNDIELFEQLEVLRVETMDFLDRLNDTQFLAGAEAYSVCLIYYQILETAARAGIAGADERYNRLKGRFQGQGPQRPTPSPTPRPGNEGDAGNSSGTGAENTGTPTIP